MRGRMVRAANCSFNNNLRGHDHVRIHRPQGHAHLARHFDPPALRFPHGIFVANHHGRPDFLAEFQQTVIGIRPQNESDAAGRQFLREVRNAFDQEAVVPKVGARIERERAQKKLQLASSVRWRHEWPHPGQDCRWPAGLAASSRRRSSLPQRARRPLRTVIRSS